MQPRARLVMSPVERSNCGCGPDEVPFKLRADDALESVSRFRSLLPGIACCRSTLVITFDRDGNECPSAMKLPPNTGQNKWSENAA
jgi:hypothetical protein